MENLLRTHLVSFQHPLRIHCNQEARRRDGLHSTREANVEGGKYDLPVKEERKRAPWEKRSNSIR